MAAPQDQRRQKRQHSVKSKRPQGDSVEPRTLTLKLATPEETEALGARLYRQIKPGMVIFLKGPLGAGKTTLVRGFLKAGGWKGAVRSPTFTLKEPYETLPFQVLHYDLYRLASPEELEWLGLRDDLDGRNVLLFEWPERGEGVLPTADLVVELIHLPTGRGAKLCGQTPQGFQVISNMAEQC